MKQKLEKQILEWQQELSKQKQTREQANQVFNESNKIEAIDSYLCELKESQIRTGLHTFGSRQKYANEINLILEK